MRKLALLALLVSGCGGTATLYHPAELGRPRAGDDHTIPTQRFYRAARGNTEQANYYSAGGCGVERWSVKTLTDPFANQVTFAPQNTWVGDLVSIAPPLDATDRVGPTETQTFRLTAALIYAKAEADGDVHLVVEDTTGDTMIVESTDPKCANGSLVLRQMEEVRSAIVERLPRLPQGRIERPLPVTVTGVGFFDRPHGQTGAALNGIELHPLLSVGFGAGTVRVPYVQLLQRGGTD